MSRSITAIVMGGLGNQLFIYAAARALALRTGRSLYLDTHYGFTQDAYGRSYRLHQFPIVAEPLPPAFLHSRCLDYSRRKLVRAFSKFLPRDLRSHLFERRNQPPSQLTALNPRRERVNLFGYWQNEAYFVDYADVIRRELMPPEPLDDRNRRIGERLASNESIFLHVRRVRYPYLLSREYYQAAVDAACASVREPQFALYGDDLRWPQEQLDFHGHPVEVIAHNSDNELADLWLMTRCRHGAIANSTFSWWGAWLGGSDPGRMIFFPAKSGLRLVPASNWRLLPASLESPALSKGS